MSNATDSNDTCSNVNLHQYTVEMHNKVETQVMTSIILAASVSYNIWQLRTVTVCLTSINKLNVLLVQKWN